MAKRQTIEEANTIVKELREQMQIMPLLQRWIMLHGFNEEERKKLHEFNGVKAVLNDCAVVGSGEKRVILLPVVLEMLTEMKVQNRMVNI